MKKTILFLNLIVATAFCRAQGLENLIVEKYYVSDANDTSVNASGGVLPVGSVTYRIYADMLPGYKFQSAYGSPTHTLFIQTSTLFFNNEDRGATTPTYTKNQAKSNTVMLDSWLSVGAACVGNFGILKSLDDGVATVANNEVPPVLQNNDPTAGLPLTSQDGMIAIAGRTPEPVTTVGISGPIDVFNNQNDGTNGPMFSVTNGAWASLNGSYGPDSMDNKVLIAQITTDGILSFELNIQIGTPSGGVEQYVAQNPAGAEIQMASLVFNSSLNLNVHSINPVNPVFTVYPNPAGDFLNVEVKNVEKSLVNKYTLYDMRGCIVLDKELGIMPENFLESIDVSSLKKGQYVLELVTDGSGSVRKIIKD